MARGNGRMRVFLDDIDYRTFVRCFAETLDDFTIECWNYCVMPNHYHATLRPTRPNLSDAMRQLNGTYAQWWNRRHKTVGHVFQGRFKDQIVQQESYLSVLCRYVANNPVRAGLVKHPADWPWSSYAATIGLRPPPQFLATDLVLRQFGEGDRQVLQQRFAAYVCASADDDGMEDGLRSPVLILGDKAFQASVKAGSDHGLTPAERRGAQGPQHH